MTVLHQQIDGAGQAGVPIVFSHALGLDLGQWDGVVQTVALRHPVLRYDQRGHGHSPLSPTGYSMDDLVEDAVSLIEAWGRGPVVFVGLSMGGMVGQGLALRRPDLLHGLVLAHTVARYTPPARSAWVQRIDNVRRHGMAAVADMVVERYLNAAFRASQPHAAQALRRQILAMDPVGYAQACEAVAGVDWLDRLPQVNTPTLVLAGAQDVGATPEMARDIANRVPGAWLEVFPAASHLSVLEDPVAFHRALTDFVGTLPREHGARWAL